MKLCTRPLHQSNLCRFTHTFTSWTYLAQVWASGEDLVLPISTVLKCTGKLESAVHAASDFRLAVAQRSPARLLSLPRQKRFSSSMIHIRHMLDVPAEIPSLCQASPIVVNGMLLKKVHSIPVAQVQVSCQTCHSFLRDHTFPIGYQDTIRHCIPGADFLATRRVWSNKECEDASEYPRNRETTDLTIIVSEPMSSLRSDCTI